MSTKVNAALNRRTAIRAGAVGAAATAATVATATGADAAAGQPVLQGLSNNAGTAGTTLISTGSAISLTVRNNGTGAAAFFFGQNNNGFAGGTGAGSKYGLSAANTGVASSGAAMAASGSKNTGVLANTANTDRFAVEAVNLSTVGTEGAGGGLYAEGGEVPAAVAVSNVGVPAVISVGDTIYIEGHEVVHAAGGSTFLGVVSLSNKPQVQFKTLLYLDHEGNGQYDLAMNLGLGHNIADLDLNYAMPSVTSVTGPMPNIWATVSSSGIVQVQGGAVYGRIYLGVTVHRKDWGSLVPGAERRSAGTSRLAKAKEFTARVMKRSGRD